MTRPTPPHPAPADCRWVLTVAELWEPLDEYERPRKCSAPRHAPQTLRPAMVLLTAGGVQCNASADLWSFPPSIGRREARCANHADGVWVEMGICMHWQLVEIDSAGEGDHV